MDSCLASWFDEQVMTWQHVTSKFMFGCLAYLARGKLFAFIYDDNIVVTNLDERSRENLATEYEAFPFETQGKAIGGWIEVVVNDESELSEIMPYVHQSYEAALEKAQSDKKKR